MTNLTEMRYDAPSTYEGAGDTRRGQYSTIVPSTWGKGGKVFVRQIDPLPMDILAIHPSIDISERR